MFKKLCLSVALAALSIASSNQCSDQPIAANTLIGHIAQEKYAIVMEINKTMVIGEKAIEHIKSQLGDTYEQLVAEVTAVVNEIIPSEEFSSSLAQLTDYQVRHIVEEGLCFNDIPYQEIKWMLPLDLKVKSELSKAFPSLDKQTEQLFNIFYVTIANFRGCKLLLEKLDLQQAALRQELPALRASDTTISE